MGISISGCAVASRLSKDSKPGIYKSAKGSLALKPEKNITKSGKDYNGFPDSVLITDVDSGKTFLKPIDSLKGVYTFVAPLDKVDLKVNA